MLLSIPLLFFNKFLKLLHFSIKLVMEMRIKSIGFNHFLHVYTPQRSPETQTVKMQLSQNNRKVTVICL